MKYSIVIPTYNHCNDLLKPCIESIIKYTDLSQTEIIVVANGCIDDTREYVNSLNNNINLVWFDDAIGYPKAVNAGIKVARGEWIVLLNNDTLLTPQPENQWLQRLQAPFLRDPLIAVTGPTVLKHLTINSTGVVFYCAMIKSSVFGQIGLLDENYSPGGVDDHDFCHRAVLAGFKISDTGPQSFPIIHYGNKTFRTVDYNYNQILQRNNKYFMDKFYAPIKYSIVIPTYNHCDDLLKPCIDSIIKYTNLSGVEVIVVANGCTDRTREYVSSLGHPFKLVWLNDAAGYTKATNAGINEARGEYIILMNNDVILLEQPKNNWLALLEKPFSDPKTGITGPVKFKWDCYGVEREAMAFWLVMIKADLFNKIGILDEIFSPGMGEDGDFCVRAAEAGYKSVAVPENVAGHFDTGIVTFQFPVYHVGNGTFADDNKSKDEVIQRNKVILDTRWGPKSKRDILVSIIVPTARHYEIAFNPGITALLAATDLSNKEIIVVANGSPTETRQRLHDLEDQVRYVWFDKPQGYIKAVNAGIRLARGKYVITLDDDSHLYQQPKDMWINILLKPFLEDPLVGASSPFANEYENMGLVLHSGCTMYKRDLLVDIGMFDEIYHPGYFSDSDVSMKVWRAGYKCVEVPAPEKDKKYQDGMFEIKFPVIHTGQVQTMDKKADHPILVKNREILYSRYGKNMKQNLELIYNEYSKTPSTVNEHFPTLRKYAEQCARVTEFGTGYVVTTYALLAGLPKKLVTYDLVPHRNIWNADTIAKQNGVELTFMERDVTKVDINPTDLLYIGGALNYQQCVDQLNRHAKNVEKYIIISGTESITMDKAINDFMASNASWRLREHFKNNNGLTVMERINRNNMQTKPKYSIVIPTYNHCDDLLKPCIESIKKYSDMSTLEIIVSANGCTDNTREYVESLGQGVKLVWSDEALGYTKATNAGIRASSGDFVVLLNNDTELLVQAQNQWLEQLSAPFQDETVGLTGPLQLYDNYAGSDVLIFFCVMIKRSLFDIIGLLDEVYTPGGGEDIDFSVRAKLAGYKAVQLEETVFSREARTNVGHFPIWHKDNRTFRDIPEYTNWIVKRNGHLNAKRYNKKIKLNLGAGGINYPGFLSVDFYDKRADIKMDITKLDFPDNSVDEILASHVFEHLNPYHCLDILKDWRRVLRPGGKLVMEMPDIEQLCKRFVTASTGERYGILNAVYGSVNTTGEGGPDNITSPHLFGWWPQSLHDHLWNAGYTNIEFMDEKIPHPESNLRVEAVKPLEQPDTKKYQVSREEMKKLEPGTYIEVFELNSYGINAEEIAGSVVVDVGANLGMFSLYCAELGAKKILAVEAQPVIFNTGLLHYIRGYETIVPINYAVMEHSGKTVNIVNHHVGSKVGEIGDPVTSVSLQKLLNDHFIVDNDMVLKLDCEGSEFNIIMTAKCDFMRRFKSIHIELHGSTNANPAWRDTEVIRQRLTEFGFIKVKSTQQFDYTDPNNPQPQDIFVEKWVRI